MAPNIGYETLIYDCMIGDADAVPARRQRRGRLARGAARCSTPGPNDARQDFRTMPPAAMAPKAADVLLRGMAARGAA